MKKKPIKNQLFLHTPLDIDLILAVVFLNIFGLIMIYSASYYYAVTTYHYSPTHFLMNQLKYVVAGLVLMVAVSYVRPSTLKMMPWWIPYVAMFFILFAVRIPGLGWASHGAYRWIKIPKLGTIQVAEPIKICAIWFLANYMTARKITEPRVHWFIYASFAFLALGLLFISNNLSTAAIVFLMMYFTMMIHYPRVRRFWYLIVVGVVFVLLAILIIDKFIPYSETEGFRLTRVRAWLHPTNELFSDDTAYQATQALYAIASGGFFGKGLGQSLLKFKLPEPHNDYILAIVFEELGVFGAALLTYLFIYLLYRIFLIYKECKDRHQQILVLGVFLHIAIQVLLNYAVTLGFFPTTGVTLPFISAGGSSAFFTLGELGVVMAVGRQTREYRIYQEAEKELEEEDPYYRELKDEQRLKKKRAEHEKYLEKREQRRKMRNRTK